MGGNGLGGGTTRLDGLLSLLDTGSNASVRNMAASQIGELVAAHPSETRPVLRRVRRLLRSSLWETRIAAGQAIAAIAEHTPRFIPQNVITSESAKEEGHALPIKSEDVNIAAYTDSNLSEAPSELPPSSFIIETGLEFQTFDLEKLMREGAMLFGSTGDEYNGTDLDIATQRARLKADLGLNDKFLGGDVLGSRLGLNDDDLMSRQPNSMNSSADFSSDNLQRRAATEFVAEMSTASLSARERNRLRRMAKRKAKAGLEVGQGKMAKRPRTGDPDSSSGEVFSLNGLAAIDDEDAEIEGKLDNSYWDFQPTCEVLKEGLLLPRWEWRHGSAIGLRHILMRHAQSAGRRSIGSEGDAENTRWLEDLCCRLLCVLALDRFGDFVGDAVVAPVREAAAMTIGAASGAMSDGATELLLHRLLLLLSTEQSTQWEVRHAALLGVRYVLAVNHDMAKVLLGIAYNSVSCGLQDPDDDVRAVAAEALLPVVLSVIRVMPSFVPRLVTNLWEALLDLDDISASTSSVMKLLSEISGQPSPSACYRLWLEPDIIDNDSDTGDHNCDQMDRDSLNAPLVLSELVSRLWPFLRHSSKGVRRASMDLLNTVSLSLDEEELLRWVLSLSADLFSRLFRNIILETEDDILQVSQLVWERTVIVLGKRKQHSGDLVRIFKPLISQWIQTASQETRAEAAAFDDALSKPKAHSVAARRKAAAARRAAKARKAKSPAGGVPYSYGSDSTPAVEGPYEGAVMQRNASFALGLLAVCWPLDDPSYQDCIVDALSKPFGLSRRVACDVLQQWAERSEYDAFVFSDKIKITLEKEIASDGNCAFVEVGSSVGTFFSDTLSFLNNIPFELDGIGLDITSLKSTAKEGKKAQNCHDLAMAAVCAQSLKPKIHQLVTGDTWEYVNRALLSGNVQKSIVNGISTLRMSLLTSLGYMDLRTETIRVSLSASATAAFISARGCALPQKVGPMIRTLTAAIRTMVNPHLQRHAAAAISKLALRLAQRDPQKPLILMLKNLMKYLTTSDGDNGDSEKEIMASLTSSRATKLEPGPLAKRGALLSMKQLCITFNSSLFMALPCIWSRIADPLTPTNISSTNSEVREAMIILRAIVSHLHHALHDLTSTLFPHVVAVCAAPHDGYVDVAPKCLADAVNAIPSQGMQAIVMRLIPLLKGSQNEKVADKYSRRGAAKALRAVVDKMGTDLIPYAAFMVVPMMARMVDEDEVVRNAASGVFGTIIRLMPLEGSVPDDPSMSASMAAEKRLARSFLGQLLGSEPRQHYELPVEIGDNIQLRKYQQECLDWLAFLNRYGLHGALCDDMGLGKTLMTLCMIAGDFHDSCTRGQTFPSLVVCPSTIVAHWVMEAQRFFGQSLPYILQYSGLPRVRARIRGDTNMQEMSLIVTSYDVLSNDLRYLDHLRLNYLVLDEGHVIKNSKTKVARAVRALSADHRLILTGTPVQNSVLELWAMFDFLMPGFLGTEKAFNEQYSKPIMASRDTKCSEVDHERGLLATESLHRQVLPFVLRRLKDDVLTELPPKIMQDYYCNMTPLQHRLYEDFASDLSKGGGLLTGSEDDESNHSGKKGNTFKALSYLRRLCSHPKLVLTPKHPEFHAVHRTLKEQGKSIDDITSSAKLVGLMNILHECGIGKKEVCGSRGSGGHRALIFAQLKQMLDLVETDLFRVHMPDVTYLRLDGSVETSKRQPVVTRFNADPTIDCLLLTTHVGGLGLNLTGADTVIFLEHDWNPTKDLQAMDRAHRMGQKRTVNVYRLITRGTMEEKIMGIQKFKTHIANTVVNKENSTLQSMNTEQLLDLFKVEPSENEEGEHGMEDINLGAGKGMKAALAGLGELWEESQYENEYNMDTFLAGMNNSKHEN